MLQVLNLSNPKDLEEFLNILQKLNIKYVHDTNRKQIKIEGKVEYVDIYTPQKIFVSQNDIRIKITDYIEDVEIKIEKHGDSTKINIYNNIIIKYAHPELIISY